MDKFKVDIRIATIQDAPFIALLARITFSETFGRFFRDKNDLLAYYNRTFTVEKIKNGLQNSRNIFWIAFVNDMPVGYSKLKLKSKSEFTRSKATCQLQKIYVLKDYLAMKIGTELLDVLISKAKQTSSEEIWLSVLDNNERAIRFYKKHGFKNVGKHDFQIGKENFEFIVMSKVF